MALRREFVALCVCFAADIASAATSHEAINYSIQTLITSDRTDNIRGIGQSLLTSVDSVEPAVFDLAAEMAEAEVHKERIDPIKLIWLARIIGTSNDGKYRSFLQSIAQISGSRRVKTEVAAVLEGLATSSQTFTPNKSNLESLQRSMADARQSHATKNPVSINAVKKVHTLIEAYELLGWPDHIEMRYKFGLRVSGWNTLNVVWDNRYRIVFQYRPPKLLQQGWLGQFFKEMYVNNIYPLPDFSDPSAVRRLVPLTDAKAVASLMRDAHRAYVVPGPVLDAFAEYIDTNAGSADSIVLDNMRRMSAWLASSKNLAYAPALTKLRQNPTAAIRNVAVKMEYKLYVETGNVQLLYPQLNGDDVLLIRLAVEAILVGKVYDPVTLGHVFALIEKNVATGDPMMVGAVAEMLKVIGHSGDSRYKAGLTRLLQTVQNDKLRKHFNAAVTLLDDQTEGDEDDGKDEDGLT